jgi:hypothetical protein
MQDVMWDIVRAEEFLNGYVIYRDTSIDKIAEAKKWYDKIYQLHKITKKDFDKSYAYYNGHPDLMKQILDSLSKKTPPHAPGQASSKTTDTLVKKDTLVKRDILIKKDTLLKIDRRKRMFDTLNKKRILKKIPAPQ